MHGRKTSFARHLETFVLFMITEKQTMEDSSNASGSISSSPSISPSPFALPSGLRRKREGKRASSSGSRKYESDDSYNSDVKRAKYGGNHVSKWDTCMLESFGIFYDGQQTELSELYESALRVLHTIAVRGVKDHAAFWNKLLEMKEFLMESTKKCMHSFDVDEKFAKMNVLTPEAVEEVAEKCVKVIEKIKEEMSTKISSLDNLSRHIFSIWHTGILEYVQYYYDLIKELSFERRFGVEGEFSQLLIFFSKIFLLNPMRGDAKQKMQMRLNGVITTSVPDLRYRLQGTEASLMTVTVGEVKMWEFFNENTTTDFNIRDWQSAERLLGQHGGELLVESKNSALRDTNLGIICIKTMIIFTCLKLDTEHLSNLEQGFSVGKDRSIIRYSKPYNFLVTKDREEILDTMFHLGLLCRFRSLHLLQD